MKNHPFSVEYQAEQQIYQVMEMNNQEETESIANDILGLLGDQKTAGGKAMEETIHKVRVGCPHVVHILVYTALIYFWLSRQFSNASMIREELPVLAL